MHGVLCGPQRCPVDPTTLRYLPADGMWMYECVGGEFELAGDADGPDPIRFDLAQRVAAHIDLFVTNANDYLLAFVVPGRFESRGPWMLQSVAFGLRLDDSVDDFELFLVLDGDTYGLWSVQFCLADTPLGRYFPNQFSRRQW